MLGRAYYQQKSEEAIRYVQHRLPFGAYNQDHALQHRAVGRITSSRSDAILTGRGADMAVTGARISGAGNCGEMAGLAYDFLKRQGVPYIHLIIGQSRRTYYGTPPWPWTYGANHEFVVMGINRAFSPDHPGTWGDSAVICDPWIVPMLEERGTFSMEGDGINQYWDIYDESWDFQVVKDNRMAGHALECPF